MRSDKLGQKIRMKLFIDTVGAISLINFPSPEQARENVLPGDTFGFVLIVDSRF